MVRWYESDPDHQIDLRRHCSYACADADALQRTQAVRRPSQSRDSSPTNPGAEHMEQGAVPDVLVQAIDPHARRPRGMEYMLCPACQRYELGDQPI